MTYKLNEKLEFSEPYIVNENVCAIRLDANESFIDPGEELREKILTALRGVSFNRYPDNSYKELRQVAGNLFDTDPDLMVIGNGSDELLSLLIGSFLKSDDLLMLRRQDFSMYSIFASVYERKTCFFEENGNGEPDIHDILTKIQEQNVNAVLFSNPNSANSTVTAKERILELADNTDALVIIDEAYMDFSDQSVSRETAARDNLIVLRTCSKALGCAGIRLGFALSSERIINVLNALRPPYNLNILTEAVACAVLSETGYIKDAISHIVVNSAELYKELKALEYSEYINKIYPTATNFICIETDHADYIHESLKARSIMVRNFKKRLRITVGTKEENKAVAEGIKNILKDIKNNDDNAGKGGKSND